MIASSSVGKEPIDCISRIAVQVVIYSETLSPGDISTWLNLQPTNATEMGIKLGQRTGTPVTVPRHMWQLSSESNVEILDFGCHLDWLLSKLLPVREQLIRLRDGGAAECTICGVVWTSGSSAHLELSVPQIEALVSLQLRLELEFTDYGDDA